MDITDEIVECLRRLATGETTCRPVRYTWDGVFAGDFTMKTSDGWTITIFNDCDSFDYVDSATSPDGRTFDCNRGSGDGTWIRTTGDEKMDEALMRVLKEA